MRSVVYLVSALFLSTSVLAASISNDGTTGIRARHAHKQHAHHLGRDLKVTANSRLTKRSPKKRCKAKSSSTSELASATSTTKPAATSSSNTNDDSSSSSSSSGTGNIGGILADGKYGSNCDSNAVKKTTSKAGPNGSEDFLRCGFTGGGWAPPKLTMDQLHFGNLDDFAKTTFKPCSSDAIAAFKKYGEKYNVAPIILASFAMQESTCNLSTMGKGGEVGMFQLSPDKCKGKGTSACKDLDFQADAAASYFRSQIDDNDGNVVVAVGYYNGYYKGITQSKVDAAPSCCRQNAHYHHETMNYWWQGLSPY